MSTTPLLLDRFGIDLQKRNWTFKAGFMSARVYLSTHTCPITHEEEIPVCIRIQLSRTTVKDLHSRLQHAYQRADVRLVRRITVLLDQLVHRVPMAVLCERWGLSREQGDAGDYESTPVQ
jgi:hypothetical protein